MASTTPMGTEHTISSAAQALLADPEFGEDNQTDLEEEEVTEEVEAEAEEDEAESEGEETEEVEADDEPEPDPEPAKYTLRVDGEEVEVTLDELRAGYSRQADYTRKTQEIAQQRKAIEAELKAAREAREAYAKRVEEVAALLPQEQEPTPEQWQRLYETDPVEWVRQRELAREKKEKRASLVQEQQQLMQQRQQEQAKQFQELVAENQRKLIEAMPEWTDPETAKREREGLRSTLREYGFGDEEIGQIYDHRAVLVARDAWKYRQMMSKKSSIAPAKPKTKTASPGAASTPAEQAQSSTKKLRERLQQTGKVADAAKLFESMV